MFFGLQKYALFLKQKNFCNVFLFFYPNPNANPLHNPLKGACMKSIFEHSRSIRVIRVLFTQYLKVGCKKGENEVFI